MDIKVKGVRVWSGFKWLRIVSSTGSQQHDTEPSSFIKGEEFPSQLTDYHSI
jgi:hypothetical protein